FCSHGKSVAGHPAAAAGRETGCQEVSEAHKRKNGRLKQAKEEAQAEIEQYRLQREEFKAKEAAALGSHREADTGEDDRPPELLPAEQG
ncbi:V-type proton ATPase subunit G 1, partial [Sigmodon hispidus]